MGQKLGLSRKSPESVRKEPYSQLRNKVVLVWILRYHSFKASLDIVRFICSDYLGVSLSLALFTPSNVYLHYDFLHKQWLKNYPHSLTYVRSPYEVSLVLLSGSRVFLCGLGRSGKGTVVLEGGAVELSTDTHWWHRGAGVLYVHQLASVFVFCGIRTRFSEQYFPQSGVWRRLPPLSCEQSHFNPCLFHELIYLASGLVDTVETYNPRLNQFQSLRNVPLGRLSRPAFSAFVPLDDELLVLTSASAVKMKNGQWVVTPLRNPSATTFNSNCTPVVYEGTLFSVNMRLYHLFGIDLATFSTITRDQLPFK